MFQQVTYFSKATTLMDEPSLNKLLNESRKRNKTAGITGMLIYFETKVKENLEGRFIQAMEGPKDELELVFRDIQIDTRHRNVTILNSRHIQKRDFRGWVMGFEILRDRNINIDGCFLLDHDFSVPSNNLHINIPLNYLKTFYSLRRI